MTTGADNVPERTLLVGVDGSSAALDAVRWAAHDAELRGWALHLVTALPPPVVYGPVLLPQSYFDEERTHAEQVLDQACEAARAVVAGSGRVSVRGEVVHGSPPEVLLDRAAQARMVVVGSRGLNAFTSGLLGSVSSALAAHCPCPLTVVRGLPAPEAGGERGGDVVVGVDGSELSNTALAEAFAEAEMRGTGVVAVHAWTDFDLASAFRDSGAVDAAVREAEKAVLAECLAGWGDRYPDVPVRRRATRDRPVRSLLDAAEGAQLLVVGSRGRGGFKGMLLGSTSRALLHLVDCPLMIVRHEADEGPR